MTFHNGPFPATAQLLDTLAAKNVKATFFITGIQLQTADRVAILQRAYREGHTIATDSHKHLSYANMTQEELNNDVTRANMAILNAIGVRPRYMRPPFGDRNDKLYQMLTSAPACYDRVILWNLDVLDWKYAVSNPNAIPQVVDDFMAANPWQSVIHLQTDMVTSVVAQVGDIIDKVRAQGYTIVTLPECIGEKGVSPYLDLGSCNTAWTPTDAAGSSVVPQLTVLMSALFVAVASLWV